jgi:RNA recognition motif-containing protein
MANKLYVGNIAQQTTREQLKDLFSKAGEVVSINIVVDRETRQRKGKAFVEMLTEANLQDAIKQFDGYMLENQVLVVREARLDNQRPRGNGPSGNRL